MGNSDDYSDKVQVVVLAERAWLKAHLELDIAALDSLMADEYLQVDGQAARATRAPAQVGARSDERRS